MRGINHPRYDTHCMVAPILYGRLYFDLQKIGNAPVINYLAVFETKNLFDISKTRFIWLSRPFVKIMYS